MQFDERLATIPACVARTQKLYALLASYPQFKTNPATPQSNMLHLHLPTDKDSAMAIRNRIAKNHGVWLFNNAVHTTLPGQCMFEWYVGDQMLSLDDEAVRHALDLLAAELAG
jgi:hypothetical protein